MFYLSTRPCWLCLPILMLALQAFAGDTQKPAGWIELATELTLRRADTAELTLQLTSAIPSDHAVVRLRLPQGTQAVEPLPWAGKLAPHETTTLTWTLRGDFDFTTPIALEVSMLLGDGQTLSQDYAAAWSDPYRRAGLTRSEPIPGARQTRSGEALWVVPLAAESP